MPQPREASTFVQNLLVAFTVGVIYSQPMLLSLVAVLWPASWLRRSLVAVALLVAVCQAYAVARIIWYGRASAIETVVFPWAVFAACWMLSRMARRFYGWRLQVCTAPEESGLPRNQFSLRSLLLVLTAAAALMATGRPLAPRMNWEPFGVVDVLLYMLIAGGIGGSYWLAGLAMMPVILAAKPTARQKKVAAWLLLGFAALNALLFFTSFSGEALALAAGIVMGMFASFAATFAVLRACGYRLVGWKRGQGLS
jgi:hypothetical protein